MTFRAILAVFVLAAPAAARAQGVPEGAPMQPPPPQHESPDASAPGGPVHARAEVLFTFDDGPKLETTPKVMAELDRRNIKAIFFVNGWKFERDERVRDLLREELQHGHYVGNHTYSHRILCRHLDIAPREIDRNQELIESVLGFRPALLRTPYGQHCKKLKQIVSERGFDQIGWDIDAQEWRSSVSVDYVVKYITTRLARLHGRGIVLMHDTRATTVHALTRILDWLDQHPEIKIVDWRVLLHGKEPIRPLLEGARFVHRLVARALCAVRAFPLLPRLAGAPNLVL